MTEPDVALTDFALALEGAFFSFSVMRLNTRAGSIRAGLAMFFAAISAASLLGGLVHGFFNDEHSRGYAILWPATLLVIGVATMATFTLGAALCFPPRVLRWVVIAAGLELIAYAAVVLFVRQDFFIAVLSNVLSVLFLIACVSVAFWRGRGNRGGRRRLGLLSIGAGAVLIILGGVLQQLRVAIDPVYFNHNALYHAIQAVTLLLFYWGGKPLITDGDAPPLIQEGTACAHSP